MSALSRAGQLTGVPVEVRRSSVLRWLGRQGRRSALWIVLVDLAAIAVFAGINVAFVDGTNLTSLALDGSEVVLLAVAEALLLSAGEFDISLGANLVIASVIGAEIMVHLSGTGAQVAAQDYPSLAVGLGVGIPICLVVGALMGAFNGFVVTKLRVNSLIATLGMSTVTTGIALAATNSSTVPNPYNSLGNAITSSIGGIGTPFYVALGAVLVLWAVLERTRWGRNAYFVGAGRRAAAYAGIKVNRTRTVVFVYSAVASWLAGVIAFGQSGSADATFGTGYLLTVIAAVFLGYTAIRPGRYNAIGSLVGMLVIAIGTTGIEVLAAPIWLTDVFSGAILFVAVALANVLGTAKGFRALRSAID